MNDMNPDDIDMEMACRMVSNLTTLLPDDKPYTWKSDFFHSIIDFDELAAIKPPRGHGIKVCRGIHIRTLSFRGLCPGAVHYYCDINFSGPRFVWSGSDAKFTTSPKLGGIFGTRTLNVNRPVTEEDLANKYEDWNGYDVGDLTHRWHSSGNAIECAIRIVRLKFRNYGKIYVEDCGGNDFDLEGDCGNEREQCK